jgi:hypothetical protein
MKSRCLRSLLAATLAAFACLLVHGCRRTPTKIGGGLTTGLPPGETDTVWNDARDAFRFARPSDDWTRFREFLPKFNAYFARSEIQTKLRLTEAERKFLTDEVHLRSAELAEIEATEFRTADAHFLDECYLLRDAARSLEAPSLDTAERKTHALFRWVMRNVLLHEQVDSWIPPAFALRRGHGSAVERSLVFLALLRQEKLEGCLIVVPDTDPLQFLIGVPDAKAGSVMLFDARLGLPVVGKDGRSIATLKETLADPKLLGPSQITPEQAKKLEAWLVCPAHALSPRMFELQVQLGRLDRVVLHQNPLSLSQEIAKLAAIPVKVWNPPAQGPKVANSPTRCLELFLPRPDGGQDTTGRAALINQTRVPAANVTVNFGQINVTAQLLQKDVFLRLFGIAGDFLVKYDLQPREMYLRGQYEAMRQRQERIMPLVETKAYVGDKEFDKERADWFTLIRNASANLEDRDPAVKGQAKQTIDSLGGADFLLHWMIDVDSEKKLADIQKELNEMNVKGDQKRSMPTKILAVGLREHFDFELDRSRAAASHEKAERAEATLRGVAKPSESAVKRASDFWIMAKSAWANFYVAKVVLAATIDQRLAQMRSRVRPVIRSPAEEIELRLSLLETLHLDVQRYFNANLRLAECLEHTHPDGVAEGVKASKAYLEKTKREIEQVEAKGLLRDEIKTLQDLLPRADMQDGARAMIQRRLDLLARDWSERGSYFWLKKQIDQRVK